MSSINLLDPSLGIQTVMSAPDLGASSLPEARPLASTTLSNVGLDELYAPKNARQIVETALCPSVGDGELLQPEIFLQLMHSAAESLQKNPDPDVQAVLTQELQPLLANNDLLSAYRGLMIGG